MPRPFLLGLTGNIACGKSSVGRLLADRHGAEYVDADRLVHDLYAPGGAHTRAILDRFGPDLALPDGSVNRRRLGELVLRDQTAMRDLEAILVPAVRAEVARRIETSTAEVLVLDAIKLIESGLADRCQTVWTVACDRATRLARLQASRGLSPEQAALRVDAQAPQEAKIARADVVLWNDGSHADLADQVARAWQRSVQPRLAAATAP